MEDWLWRLLPVALLIIQGLFVWGMWSMRKQFQTRESCDDAMAQVHKRVTCLEKKVIDVEHLPSSKDFATLTREVAELRGGQRALEEGVKSLGISIDRLERPLNLLLEHSLGGQK